MREKIRGILSWKPWQKAAAGAGVVLLGGLGLGGFRLAKSSAAVPTAVVAR